ncbi:hypothetical protein [Providencia hangzhouensis]|uniref:hypothetical protein n=1 Tax=Providencia hangzhouensis TaxID=3031799 RepID=UPI0034DD1936
MLKQKEDGLRKLKRRAKPPVRRSPNSKRMKSVSRENQQLAADSGQKAQQAEKIQASLAEQTAKAAEKVALEAELAEAEELPSTKRHKMRCPNSLRTV